MNATITERFRLLREKEELELTVFTKNLINNELKGKTFAAVYQAILKIENGKQTMPPLYLIEAYCKHFNTTADYLLGIRDVGTTNEDIVMICKYTGLSQEVIERIAGYDECKKEILNGLITEDNDSIAILLNSLYLYGMNVSASDITINNRVFNTANKITDNTIVKNMLKNDVLDSLDICLHCVVKLFEYDKVALLERDIAIKEKELLLYQLADKLGIPYSEIESKVEQMKNDMLNENAMKEGDTSKQ